MFPHSQTFRFFAQILGQKMPAPKFAQLDMPRSMPMHSSLELAALAQELGRKPESMSSKKLLDMLQVFRHCQFLNLDGATNSKLQAKRCAISRIVISSRKTKDKTLIRGIKRSLGMDAQAYALIKP
jgi:hypothetical protein